MVNFSSPPDDDVPDAEDAAGADDDAPALSDFADEADSDFAVDSADPQEVRLRPSAAATRIAIMLLFLIFKPSIKSFL